MNPVLIFTDTERITKEQNTLGAALPLYQAVYNAIKAIGITATLAEVHSLVNNAKTKATADYVKNYVANKLLDNATSYVFNGVPLTRDAIKGMMQLPDYSSITAALLPSFEVFNAGVSAVNIALFTLADDVISPVADADAQIAALYTYYTKTDASAAFATALQAVCDTLNSFDAVNNNFFAQQLPPGQVNYEGAALGAGTAIPGIDLRDDSFVISLEFIQKMEQKGTLFFAA